MNQLIKANESGERINEGGLNFMVSIINGIEPRDQVEAMLAAQIGGGPRGQHDICAPSGEGNYFSRTGLF
jgi:hypothetical protein